MANKTSAANVKIKGVAPGNDIENYDPRLQNQQRPARPTTPTTSSGGSWLGGLGQAVRAVGDRVNSAVAAAPTTPAAPTGSSSAYAAQAVQAQETPKAPNVTRADLGTQAPTWNYNGQAPAFDYNGQAPANYDPETDKAYQDAVAALRQAKAAIPGYKDTYGDDIDGLYEQITGRGDFRYDLEGDPLYQQYRALYMQQGQQAMQDTMGQAAALTGGYGSSYGQSVGQQTYNGYLQRLNEVAPELYDRAYQRWLNEGDELTQRLQLARGLQSDEYGRYRDEVSDYWQNVGYADADAERAYNRGVDSWNRDRSLEDTAYNRAADQWSREYQLENDAYDRAADQWARDYTLYGDKLSRQEDERSRLTQLMQMGYTPTEEDLIAAGMTGAETQAWLDYIAAMNAPAGGGGGGSNDNTSATGTRIPSSRTRTASTASSVVSKDPVDYTGQIMDYARSMAAGGSTDSEIREMIDWAAQQYGLSQEDKEKLTGRTYYHAPR